MCAPSPHAPSTDRAHFPARLAPKINHQRTASADGDDPSALIFVTGRGSGQHQPRGRQRSCGGDALLAGSDRGAAIERVWHMFLVMACSTPVPPRPYTRRRLTEHIVDELDAACRKSWRSPRDPSAANRCFRIRYPVKTTTDKTRSSACRIIHDAVSRCCAVRNPHLREHLGVSTSLLHLAEGRVTRDCTNGW
jgi:hypothetical protein